MNKSDSYIEGEASQSGTRAVSVPSPLAAFQSAAWACAHTLLENIMYIQKELPALDLAEAQRSAIVQICSTLVGTKHDVVSELFDLQDIEGAAEPDVIQKRIERIVQMVIEDLTSFMRSCSPSKRPLQAIGGLVWPTSWSLSRRRTCCDRLSRCGTRPIVTVKKSPKMRLDPLFPTSMRK